MEFTGEFVNLTQDFLTGKYLITFSMDGEPVGYEEIGNQKKLVIKAVKHRKKRSLDANSYAWVLMGKIAAALNSSKEEIYETMLQRYGKLYEDEDGYVVITVKSMVDMSKVDGHWMKIKDNGAFCGYAMIKGSSQYDTKEMSCFIDGIASEAKELGISTISQTEIEEMKQRWKIEISDTR